MKAGPARGAAHRPAGAGQPWWQGTRRVASFVL